MAFCRAAPRAPNIFFHLGVLGTAELAGRREGGGVVDVFGSWVGEDGGCWGLNVVRFWRGPSGGGGAVAVNDSTTGVEVMASSVEVGASLALVSPGFVKGSYGVVGGVDAKKSKSAEDVLELRKKGTLFVAEVLY